MSASFLEKIGSLGFLGFSDSEKQLIPLAFLGSLGFSRSRVKKKDFLG